MFPPRSETKFTVYYFHAYIYYFTKRAFDVITFILE